MIPDRIFLIGLPGAGKTTNGSFLGKELKYPFYDVDDLIVQDYGQSIAAIFQEKGESFFREIESRILRRQKGQFILATGGGAPCFHDNMNWMNENGLTIFLNPPIETILNRVKSETHRPLLQKDPKTQLQKLWEEREKIYRKAKLEIRQTDEISILSELQSYLAS